MTMEIYLNKELFLKFQYTEPNIYILHLNESSLTEIQEKVGNFAHIQVNRGKLMHKLKNAVLHKQKYPFNCSLPGKLTTPRLLV